ncbi:MAG: NUDIX domain-containing protein [bacterium]|nr:NUDIX domain-containing protein [bacterium]
MQIKSQFTDKEGKLAEVTYKDADSFEHLLGDKVTQAYGVCFVGDKIIVVYSIKGDERWILPGGSIEKGETFEESLKREIQEESNMRVISYAPIGYQEVHFDGKVFNQLRYVCIVEPYGDFVSDPDGSITEIKLIDPKDYKQYFDWGEIGDHIVGRAVELRESFLK